MLDDPTCATASSPLSSLVGSISIFVQALLLTAALLLADVEMFALHVSAEPDDALQGSPGSQAGSRVAGMEGPKPGEGMQGGCSAGCA